MSQSAIPASPLCVIYDHSFKSLIIDQIIGRFVREDSVTISHSCLSPCVYEKEDKPGKFFCFAQGDKQVMQCCEMSIRPRRPHHILVLSTSISKVVCGESAGTKGKCLNFFLIQNFLKWFHSESQSCFAVRYEQGMNPLPTFLLSGWQMVSLQSQ